MPKIEMIGRTFGRLHIVREVCPQPLTKKAMTIPESSARKAL